MKYLHCVFDLYGTLVDIHTDEGSLRLWTGMADFYRSRGADWQPEDAYFREVFAEEHGRTRLRQDAHEAHPEIQLEAVFQCLFRLKGVTAGMHFQRLSTDYIRLYDGVLEFLTRLRGRGYRLCLLSNAQSMFTRIELEQLGLMPYFDGIFLSSDYGVKKPDRRFFDMFFRGSGISPSQAVMIGNDGVCDIQGAREAGMAAVYLRSNLSPNKPVPYADLALARMDWGQVEAFLDDGDCR